jgi:hypothetical protein
VRLFFPPPRDWIKADAIAAQQLHSLRQHRDGKPRLTDVKEMFVQMRDQA